MISSYEAPAEGNILSDKACGSRITRNVAPTRGKATIEMHVRETKAAGMQQGADGHNMQKTKMWIRKAEYAKHYGIDPRKVGDLIKNGVLVVDDRGRISSNELNRTKDDVNDLAYKYELLTLSKGGKYLGISGAALKRLVVKHDIPPRGHYRGEYGNDVYLYSRSDLDTLSVSDDFKQTLRRSQSAAKSIRERKNEFNELVESEKKRIDDGVCVRMRGRVEAPESATIYMGPTNSGKSYQAVERLVSDYEDDPDGLYVYAGPLRMLAHEVYDKLRARLGDSEVGFVTGEEQVNQDAHVRCCTVEMAPSSGTSLVLDEAHWIVDPDRGQYWTNLLVGGEYHNFYVISAAEAEPTVEAMMTDARDIDVYKCDRLTPLEYRGCIGIRDVPKRSAVIAFSRKSVYAVATAIAKETKLRVGVLYGALPLDVRARQISRYVHGKFDVMVTTDVIGHGINLPIDNVVFAETEKFDGECHRSLYLWEAAQIAGRAGRYGMTDVGGVYVLTGRDWFTDDTELVKTAAAAAAGDIGTGMNVDMALITPQLSDLGARDPSDVIYALDAWSREANAKLSGRSIAAAPMTERKKLLAAVSDFVDAPAFPWSKAPEKWTISTDTLWAISGAPLDPDGDALYSIVQWVCSPSPDESPILEYFFEQLDMIAEQILESGYADEDELSDAEHIYADIEQLKVMYVSYGSLGTLEYGRVKELEDRIGAYIGNNVGSVVSHASYGTCQICGKPCKPWLKYCDSCYQDMHGWH